ncbi:MAG TPA: hypothetical protein VHO07_02170 [Streptosporangiaceae bacterium]|jgi:hypothetical protein|nr:hypothetical protein [Streptosporangiaceae bacterium]HEX2818964.1 hypothetical protein [Streptosporangiaceae bacterium]
MITGWARVGLVLACAGLAAGCGSGSQKAAGSGSSSGTASAPTVAVPLSTSLVTAQGTWAIAVMGGAAASENNFWQLFVRPPAASQWSLVTPPGVADNGGLVAAGTGTSLIIGFRPSQNLAYSPLAASTDTGKDWTPGLLDADLANDPGALAVDPSGQALALLQDGTIEGAPTAGAAAAGKWSQLTTRHALAASAPGRSCGLQALTAVSFGQNKTPMAAGNCERPGVAGVFTDASGTWQAAGPTLPAAYRGDQVQVLGLAATSGGNVALLLAGHSLLAAWSTGTHWTVPAPVAVGTLRAAGFGTGGSAWLLLSGGRAETISGPGGSWQALPAVPPGTATLAPGPGGAYDALAVSGSKLTVWRLTKGAWATVQLIKVPIEYGSSG